MKKHYAIGRRLAMAMILLHGLLASAQKAPEIDMLIRFSGPISLPQEKYIHEVLRSFDADMGIWVDRAYQQVKVRSQVPLHRAELQDAWSNAGLVIVQFGPIIHQQTEDRAPGSDPFIPGFDPNLPDPVNYQQAKAAWIAAHPVEYQRLLERMAAPTIDPE